MRVDAHHHLWRYTASEFEWIADRMRALRRDFVASDLEAEMQVANVAVQARQTVEETRWLLDCAAKSPKIAGVVGWLPLSHRGFIEENAELFFDPLLKGLRHVVQAEPLGFLEGADFNRGIAELQGTGLVYDLLIVPAQIEEAARFVDRHPQQIFVLDHLAKPDITHDGFAAWEMGFCELARREHVVCKLSGLVTEADWAAWSDASLQPYFDTAVKAYGPARLMCGSDWPVLTVASTYARWWQTINAWLAPLSETEREQIESETAVRTYRLRDGL